MDQAHSQVDLRTVARQSMIEHGFDPDFGPAVQQQVQALRQRSLPIPTKPEVRDLRGLLWSSIDNDTSRDLDQVEFCEPLRDGSVKVMVGIADVDTFVAKGTPIDQHAAQQTTTVYSGVQNFSMLPEELSTGLTSLLENSDRLCIVIEFTVSADGHIVGTDLYRASARNKAQLAYNSVGAWLEGRNAAPDKVAAWGDLQAQLKLQDQVAQALRLERYRHGALNIESLEVQAVITDGKVTGIANQQKNHATELIEDFMIAANEVVARMFSAKKRSSIRRVVKNPERWQRIVEVASGFGEQLPAVADSKALNKFLEKRQQLDPDHFPDLSLAIVKLMGPGVYVLERPNDPEQGHFGLAVQDYTHSTAPNRRFADLVTQRLIKAAITNAPPPYSDDELAAIAQNCTQKEDAAQKVEREMTKRITALAMSSRLGEVFDGIVTGVTPHGTFVRVLQPHAEGLLAQGQQGVDVGDKLRVRLTRADVERGYIDFARA